MPDARASFEQAVAEFRAWAGSLDGESLGEWECEYDHWVDLRSAVSSFLDSSNPQRWDQPSVELLLYILARDNEDEELKEELVSRPEHLLALARVGVHSTEWDARWQLADALGSVEANEGEVVSMLEAYVADADEYISRRALLALGRRRAPIAEALAQRAWNTGHEYQQMAALEVFHDLNSPFLLFYLELAEQDGRQYLVKAAKRIRSASPDAPAQSARGQP